MACLDEAAYAGFSGLAVYLLKKFCGKTDILSMIFPKLWWWLINHDAKAIIKKVLGDAAILGWLNKKTCLLNPELPEFDSLRREEIQLAWQAEFQHTGVQCPFHSEE